MDENESYTTRFQTAFKKMWSKLTQEEKQEYLSIPHFSWEWFTYITWVEKEEEAQEMTIEEICKLLGKNVKIVKAK